MDRASPMEKHVEVLSNTFGVSGDPITAQMFGNAGREHMEKYGRMLKLFSVILVMIDIIKSTSY